MPMLLGRAPSRGRTIGLAALVLLVLVASAATWWSRTRSQPPAGKVRLAVLAPERGFGTGSDTTLAHQLYHHLVAALYPVANLELVAETEINRMSELGVRTAQIEEKLLAEGYDSTLVLEAQASPDGGFRLQMALKHLKDPHRESVGEPLLLRSLDQLSPDSARALVDVLKNRVVTQFHLTAAAKRNVRETAVTTAGAARQKGRDAASQRTPESVLEALAYYRQSIRLDSNYAQAYADQADALALSVFYRYRSDESPYEMAAAALRSAAKAIALQPTLAEGYTARGYVGMVTGAPISFVRASYATAQQLSPENPSSRLWYVGLLALENRYAQALDTLNALVAVDPQSPSKRISVAIYSLPTRRFENVVSNASQVLALYPEFPFAAALQAWGLLLMGGNRVSECAAVPTGPYLGARASCIERTQGKAAARAVIDTLFDLLSNRGAADPRFDGSLYASEMSMYAATHMEWDNARIWMRRAFEDSPLGVEQRFLRSGVFSPELVEYGDSLRVEAWKRVERAAARAPVVRSRRTGM